MKRFKEYTDDSINEAKFTRLPKDLNAIWNLKNSVEYLVGKYDNGDDYNPAEMKTIEEFIKEIKKSAKTFKSKDDVDGTVYESVNEAKIAFINNGLISERIQKSGLLPLLGENNVSLNKDKMDFTKELSSTLTKLYKKYSSLPVK